MAQPEPSTKKRVVWVLGAGFSQALGGPQLKDLLASASEGDIGVRYPEKDFSLLHGPIAKSVRLLYERGRTNGVQTLSNRRSAFCERMWQNAEDFIDYVDTAAETTADNPTHWYVTRFNQIFSQLGCQQATPEQLRVTARRLIAAECCAFLKDVSPEREQWAPFRNWERNLGSRDTVITFNYDRVFEMLIEDHSRRPQEGSPPGPSAVM